MSRGSQRWWMAAIFLLAASTRLAATFALHRWDDATPGVNRQLALSLLDNGTFSFRDWQYAGPSSVATPPYPVLLATLFGVFGADSPTAYFAALALNALIGGVTAMATTGLVRRMTDHGPTGLACGFVVALWPVQVFASTYAQPIAMTSAMIVIACLLWLRSLERFDLLTWIGFCVAAGASVLLEPALAGALVVAAVAILAVRAWSLDLRLRNLVVLGAALVLLLGPWVARNREVHGEWVMTTSLWQRVWSGANENATGSDRLPLTPGRLEYARRFSLSEDASDAVRPPMMQVDLLSPEARFALRGKPEIEREALWRRWALDRLAPDHVPWLLQAPTRLAKAWVIDWDHPMAASPLARWPRLVLAVAALAALLGCVVCRVPAGAVLVTLLILMTYCTLTVANARMTATIEPLQVALVGAAVAHLVTRGLRADSSVEGKAPAEPVATGTSTLRIGRVKE